MPGHYRLVSDQGISFGVVELKAGLTTVLPTGIVRIVSGKDNHFYAIKSSLDPSTGGAIVKGDEISVPPGRYQISDPDDASAQLSEIEIQADEIRDLSLPP